MQPIKYFHLATKIIFFITTFTLCFSDMNETKFYIQEEMSPGIFVGDVYREAKLFEKGLSSISFQILGKSEVLAIEQATGIISTTQKIDRESLEACQNNLHTDCEIKLKIAFKSADDFSIISVKVIIIDINDNAPYFTDSDVVLEISEAATVGSSFELPIAKDSDSLAFSVKNYRLISDSDKFKLDETFKINGKYIEPKLVLNYALDRETKNKYQLVLIAEDGGSPVKTGSLNVEIIVSDVNDNIPIFEQKSYKIEINENIPVNSIIIKVKAHDEDSGFNGQIDYSFSILSLNQFGNLFGINELTGDIYVKGEIDYETNPTFNLSITARDKGIGAVTVAVPLLILVKDVNDNAPEITITTLLSNSAGLAEVLENSKIGTFVAHVTVLDKDSGLNGQFKCFLNEQVFSLKFAFENEYQILVNSKIDREVQSFYNVVVQCIDLGEKPQTTLKSLKINILDENDNDPVFLEKFYEGEIIENNFVGKIITTVNATDADAGENGKVTYSLYPQTISNFFSVDEHTGVLKAIVSLDREKFRDLVKFWVVAKDKGTPQRSSSAAVSINIFDLNDEYPVFTYTSYSFAVAENQDVGSEVGTVAAQDLDSSVYGDVIYSLSSDIFEIDHKSGRITTLKVLDREQVSAYHVIVYASDRGVPPLSSSASVTIHVSDENDNTPIIDFPSQTNNSIQISNLTPRDLVIGRIRARDLDTGKNGKVFYFLKNDTFGSNAFVLEPEIGTLLLTEDLKEKDGSNFILEITVQDGGIPARMAFSKLHVIVNKSLPFVWKIPNAEPTFNINLTIILLIASISGVIVTALIIAIVVLCRQDKRKTSNKYNCRLETIKLQQAQSIKKATPETSALMQDQEGGRKFNFVMEDALKHLHQLNNRDNLSTGSNVYQTCPLISPASNTYSTFPAKNQSSNSQDAYKSPLLKHRQNLILHSNNEEGESLKSANGSNTDSGHGPSEEGEFAQKGILTAGIDPSKNPKPSNKFEHPQNIICSENNYIAENITQRSYSALSNAPKMSTFQGNIQRDYGPDLLLTNYSNNNNNRCVLYSANQPEDAETHPNNQQLCNIYQNPSYQSNFCNNKQYDNFNTNNQLICLTSESKKKLLDANVNGEENYPKSFAHQNFNQATGASPTSQNLKVLKGKKASFENTSCNSIIDADELCNEIDEIFFNESQQPIKWNRANY